MPNEREYRAFSQIVQRDLEEEEKSYIVSCRISVILSSVTSVNDKRSEPRGKEIP